MFEFGKILRDTRKEKGYTLKELADAIGVKEATVQRYESGEILNVPYDKVVLISEFLKVSPSRLMGWDEPEDDASINAAASLITQSDSVLTEIIDIYQSCSDDEKTQIFDFCRFIASKRK